MRERALERTARRFIAEGEEGLKSEKAHFELEQRRVQGEEQSLSLSLSSDLVCLRERAGVKSQGNFFVVGSHDGRTVRV